MRYWDWVQRLQTAIDEASRKPFDYGVLNCGLFAAECIDAIVEGSVRARELRGSFNDEDTARAFVAHYGSIEAAVTARLGHASSNWAHARRGDVCLMPTAEGPGLGICMGAQVVMMARTGITHLRLDQATHVWRID